ncbi:hypothetical protein SteCoe_31978 [Stentor coeruleus]|uniref:Uncharacterized protein n=1 Tax=Stentor coeruleus TaxID=5963 RepID=A0A1R2B012_9CILI|nr:hypothetical protein SteCoe_31978 [Stentor coeruleus]
MVYDSNKACLAFLCQGVFLVSGPLIVCVFFLFIYVPKLKNNLNRILDILVRNWIELQIITSFAYFEIEYPEKASDILRANSEWAFFNFIDRYYDIIISKNNKSFLYTEWSNNAFKNIFTLLFFLGFYCTLLVLIKIIQKSRISSKLPEIFNFLNIDIVLQLFKLGTFRVFFSMFIEIYRIFYGSSWRFSTIIISLASFLILILYPIVKLVYIRLKYRANLEKPKIYNLFGTDYRPYKLCWREFHLLVEQSLLYITGGCIIFLKLFPKVQAIIVLISYSGLLLYTSLFFPFKINLENFEAVFSRFCMMMISIVIVIRNYYTNDNFFYYWILVVLCFWYAGKIGFLVLNLRIPFEDIKKLLRENSNSEITQANVNKDDSNQDNKDAIAHNGLEHINKHIDNLEVITTKSEKDDYQKPTQNPPEKVRVKKVSIKNHERIDIDPRLYCNRSTRKRKTVLERTKISR